MKAKRYRSYSTQEMRAVAQECERLRDYLYRQGKLDKVEFSSFTRVITTIRTNAVASLINQESLFEQKAESK